MDKNLPEKVVERMKELASSLNKWNHDYWVLNQPSVEDTIYDKHLKELEELEKKYNFILPNSPTQKVGYSISKKFQPVVRKIPMLSLNSVDNYEDLFRFDERVKKILKIEQEIDYVGEWKIDGLSVSLIYQNHHLTQISTRGNGVVGEDITFNKELIKNIPLSLDKIANCEIRGEVYMKKEEFIRLNKELIKNNGKLLANPRNAASGSLRTLVPLQNRNLHFFAYQLFFDNDKNSTYQSFNSQLECLQKLEELGFAVSPDYHLFTGIQEVKKFVEKQESKRDSLDFESDGVVIKVNNHSYYEKLGQNSKFPRWALAYKFPASVTSSQIKNVYTEVSRSGRITYVAEIEPVVLAGSRINKATLHNYAFIRNRALNIGDEVVIKKAGDVIPQVSQVIKLTNSQTPWQPPTNCPSCQEILKWNSSNIYQVCDNRNCPRKVINSLTHFASKNGLDMKGISQKIVEKLYNRQLLQKPTDFYQLRNRKPELLKIAGFKEKTVENILNSIENSVKKPLSNWLVALGIPLLSSVKAQKLTTFYPTFSSLLETIENKESEKIKDILGEETQKALENYFQNSENLELVKELSKISNYS